MCAQSKLKTFIGQEKCLLFIKLGRINSLGHRSENSLKPENITYKTPHNHNFAHLKLFICIRSKSIVNHPFLLIKLPATYAPLFAIEALS